MDPAEAATFSPKNLDAASVLKKFTRKLSRKGDKCIKEKTSTGEHFTSKEEER